MRKSKQLVNLPLFSVEEGQQIGKVKGLVVDPARKSVSVIIIEEKGWHREQKFIPFERLHSIGENAIMVEKSNCILKKSNLPEIVKLINDKIEIIGTRLVLENGAILGQIDEFYIDLNTGEIGGLEFSGGALNSMLQGRAYLDAGFVRTFGKELTICNNECLNHIVKIEGGFQDTVRSVKNTATQAWAGALSKSRGLGQGINIPFRRKKGEPDLKEPPKETVIPPENIEPK